MESFDTWYQSTLKGPITVLESERKLLARRVGIAWGVIGLSALAILDAVRRSPLTEYMDGGDVIQWLVISTMAVGAGGAGVQKWLTGDYRHRFKSKVLPPVLTTLSDRLRHHPEEGVPERVFAAADFFPGRAIAGFEGEDLIAGEVDGHAMAMCEVQVTWQVALSKSDKTTSGWFFEAPSARVASSRVLLVSRDYRMVKAFWAKKEDREIDFATDAAFSGAFRVYARDEAAARAFLTPETRDMLVALKGQVEAPLLVSFNGDKLYGLLPSSEAFLEPTLFTSLTDAGTLKRHLAVIRMAVEAVRTLGHRRARA